MIELHEPLFQDEVTLSGHRYPLSADYSAPLAMLMQDLNPQRLGLPRLL